MTAFRRTALFLSLSMLALPPLHAEDHSDNWTLHFQATTITQGHPSFHSPYSGLLSLRARRDTKTSATSTLFTGLRIWKGGELYFDPEAAGGSGIGSTHGIAGFPNGETYRVNSTDIKPAVARVYLRQFFSLSEGTARVESGPNEIAGSRPETYLMFVGGKFSLSDFFDVNTYSHDPRTQFMNWALMANGAWDYAADTRGYTWGGMAEYGNPTWSARFASVMVPKEANMLQLDQRLSRAHSENAEIERHYAIKNRSGTVRFIVFANRAHMGSYRETIDSPSLHMDIAQTRRYRTKYGAGINLEQDVSRDWGAFLRAGWNDGHSETWAFTEIDRTASGGVVLKGVRWDRPNDVFGFAAVVNGLSKDHRDYLADGGYGFIIGDGRLHYRPETIVETYYLFKIVRSLSATADLQEVFDPGYNADRGPVTVFGGRLHYEI